MILMSIFAEGKKCVYMYVNIFVTQYDFWADGGGLHTRGQPLSRQTIILLVQNRDTCGGRHTAANPVSSYRDEHIRQCLFIICLLIYNS